jgi:hypothetical protein
VVLKKHEQKYGKEQQNNIEYIKLSTAVTIRSATTLQILEVLSPKKSRNMPWRWNIWHSSSNRRHSRRICETAMGTTAWVETAVGMPRRNVHVRVPVGTHVRDILPSGSVGGLPYVNRMTSLPAMYCPVCWYIRLAMEIGSNLWYLRSTICWIR